MDQHQSHSNPENQCADTSHSPYGTEALDALDQILANELQISQIPTLREANNWLTSQVVDHLIVAYSDPTTSERTRQEVLAIFATRLAPIFKVRGAEITEAALSSIAINLIQTYDPKKSLNFLSHSLTALSSDRGFSIKNSDGRDALPSRRVNSVPILQFVQNVTKPDSNTSNISRLEQEQLSDLIAFYCPNLDGLLFKLYSGLDLQVRDTPYTPQEIAEHLALDQDEVQETILHAQRRLESLLISGPLFLSNISRDRIDTFFFENSTNGRLHFSLESQIKHWEQFKDFLKTGKLRNLWQVIPDPGERHRFLRICNGITGSEFAEIVGSQRGLIDGFENRERLKLLTRDSLLGENKMLTAITKHLRQNLEALNFPSDVSGFMWGRSIDELLAIWKITKPGEKTTVARRLKGWTTIELAEKAEVSRATIARLQQGNYDNVGHKELTEPNSKFSMICPSGEKIVEKLGFTEGFVHFLFGKTDLEVPNHLGVTNQGERIRIVRRLNGIGAKAYPDLGTHTSQVLHIERKPEVISLDLERSSNFDFLPAQTALAIISPLGHSDHLAEVLFGEPLDAIIDRQVTPSNRLRLLRLLRTISPPQLSDDVVSVGTIRKFEGGFLNRIDKDSILKPNNSESTIFSSLGHLLRKLNFPQSPCRFVTGFDPQKYVESLKLDSPSEMLTTLRIVSGVTIAEMASALNISNAAIIRYEKDLPTIEIETFVGGGRIPYYPETIRNLERYLLALNWEGGLSRLLWQSTPVDILNERRLALEQRCRFTIMLSGNLPAPYLPLFRFIRKSEPKTPKDISKFMGKHVRKIIEMGVKASIISGGADLFPGYSDDEVDRVLQEKVSEEALTRQRLNTTHLLRED